MHALAEYHRPGLMAERPAGTRLGQLRMFLERLWAADPVLTGTGLFLTALLAASAVGIVVDSREITGAPAWLKPAKFAASTAIYSLTLAWIFTYLPDWTRTRRLVGRATALIFLIELAIIDWQAWRGTTSHFNVGTPLDATLFAVMGTAIVLQTLASVAVAVALWRQHFADRALGWALRLGLVITIVGASTGGLMTRPTGEQLAEARADRPPGDRRRAHRRRDRTAGPACRSPDGARSTATCACRTSSACTRSQLLPIVPLVLLRRSGRGGACASDACRRGRLRDSLRGAAGSGAAGPAAGLDRLSRGEPMTPEQLFSITSAVALLSWLLLVLLPGRAWVTRSVAGFAVPALFAAVYVALIATQWGSSQGGFSTLAAVAQLFANPWLLLAGWVHYLCFDLLIGCWEVRDARERGLPHLLVVPCLAADLHVRPGRMAPVSGYQRDLLEAAAITQGAAVVAPRK